MKKLCSCQIEIRSKQARQKFNSNEDKELIDFLKIISDPNRFKIITLLQQKKELCVCEIAEELELPQNLISHHLKRLTDISVLIKHRDGLKIFYKLNKKNCLQMIELLREQLL